MWLGDHYVQADATTGDTTVDCVRMDGQQTRDHLIMIKISIPGSYDSFVHRQAKPLEQKWNKFIIVQTAKTVKISF